MPLLSPAWIPVQPETYPWGVLHPLPTSNLLPVLPFNEKTMLPETLGTFAKNCANNLQTPLDYAAIIFMVSYLSILGADYCIWPKKTWEQIPNTFGMIIGPPSANKSAAFTKGLQFIQKLQDKAEERYREANIAYELEKEESASLVHELKKAISALNKKLISGKGDPDKIEIEINSLKEQMMKSHRTPPVRKEYYCNDANVASLQEFLKVNTKGCLVLQDEIMGILKKFGTSGHEDDRHFYLTGWMGNQPYTAKRVERGHVYLPNLCLSMLGATTTEQMKAYMRDNVKCRDGFIARMQLMAYPDPIREFFNRDEPRDIILENHIQEMIDKIASPGFLPLRDGEHRRRFTFDFTRVQPLFLAWHTNFLNENVKEPSEIFQEHFGKYTGLMPSLALGFQVWLNAERNDNRMTVSLEAWEMALAWQPYLRSHARRIYALGSDEIDENPIKILGHKIEDGRLNDGFTIREIIQKFRKTLGDKTDFIHGLCEVLEEMNWIRAEKNETKTIYRINPQLLKERLKNR